MFSRFIGTAAWSHTSFFLGLRNTHSTVWFRYIDPLIHFTDTGAVSTFCLPSVLLLLRSFVHESLRGCVFSSLWSGHRRVTPAGSNANSSVEHGEEVLSRLQSSHPIVHSHQQRGSNFSNSWPTLTVHLSYYNKLSSWEAESALTVKNPVPFRNGSLEGQPQPGCWNGVSDVCTALLA